MDTLNMIRAKLAAATALAAKRKEQWQAADSECAELATALRVLERFAGVESQGATDQLQMRSIRSGTMPDYVLQALLDGPKPIAAITEIVIKQHGSEIDANNIRSAAWRMWKAKRIGKDGECYHLLTDSPERGIRLPLEENEAPAALPLGASETAQDAQ